MGALEQRDRGKNDTVNVFKKDGGYVEAHRGDIGSRVREASW